MDNNYNKFISFIIAISAYILILLLILLYLDEPTIKKYNFKKKETIVQIDLITEENKINDKNINKKENQKTKKVKSIDNKVKSNLKSLFANVKVKSEKIENKKVLNVKENKIKTRFKSKYNNTSKTKNIKISKLKTINKIKNKKRNIDTNNDETENKYYSEIKQLILSRWYENPVFITDKYLVKVYITINNKGQFNFNIIKYSGKIQIDNLLTKFLNEQKDIIYPIAKDKKDKTILVNFMSEKE
jgi:protein TonB